jgi:DNA-binding transcriptional ArsR family regulator
MTHQRISASAALLADPTRVAMVLALMDGRARSAKKLALDAGVTPQTASAHLRKLVDANLLAWEGEGRCKYFRIAGAEVAHAVEALCELGSRTEPELPAAARPLRFARCCYDHLAGQLGVAITERLPRLGSRIYAELGIDLAALEALRRPLSRCCVDWTERRPHIAGSLGAALLTAYQDNGWLVRAPESRRLEATPRGRERFSELFGLDAAFFATGV